MGNILSNLSSGLSNFFSNSTRLFGVGTSFGSTSTNYIENIKLALTYEEIPEVQIVINKLANMCSLGIPKIKNLKTEEIITEHPAIDVLNNPNPLQERIELIQEFIVYYSLYGQSFQYNNRVFDSERIPKVFWNINPLYVEPNLTGKFYRQTAIDDIIKNYLVQYSNTKDTYKTKEILFKNNPSVSNPILGTSKLNALTKPISNIKGAYDSRNIFIYKRGAIGLLSPDVGKADEAGFVDMPGPEEVKKIQKQYQKTYGPLNNGHAISVSNIPMKWTPITMPLKDLMLFEEIDEDFNRIIDAFGLNRHIFSVTKGSTFDNVRNGMKQGFQDTVIPTMEDWATSLNNDWGLSEKGEQLFFDFSHLPLLQEDNEKEARTKKIKAEALQILINNGMSFDEAKESVNL